MSCGFLLGFVAGLGRVLLFFYTEDYASFEIRAFALNYIVGSVDFLLPIGLVAGLLLAGAWLLFDRIEGFILAGVTATIPLLPILYVLNKRFFPGRTDPLSLAGNGIGLLVVLGATLWLFRRRFDRKTFIARFAKKWLWGSVLGLVIIGNLLYLTQSSERKLKPAPKAPAELADLFAVDCEAKAASDVSAFKKYFGQNLSKHLILFQDMLALKDTSEVVAAADRVLKRKFNFLNEERTLPKEIDWRTNLTGDREWILALNRMDWIWDLAAAYYLTGRPQYAKAFDSIMSMWLSQNPMPEWKDESDNVWRLIETSVRITDSWIEAFAIFFNAPEVSDEVRIGMIASFHDHAQFLAHFRSPQRNHLLQETFGLLAIATAFPEFKMSSAWMQIAQKRLDFAIRNDVYSDGGYNEGSTYYHRFAIRILQRIADFAAAYDVKLSPFFLQQLEKMYEFLMHTARPDGVMSAMNDGYHAKNLRILFEKPAEMFGRKDFEFFATAGKKGHEPGEHSIYFPYSGIAVSRSSWQEDAAFAIFDGGLFGSSHGHEDKLNFELFAFGKPFVVEAGTFTYVVNRWRKYFTSSFAHNTIVVDGRSQKRFPLEKEWVNRPERELPNIWISNGHLDYFQSTYEDGYGNIKEDILAGISHTRRMIFLRPDYWVLWDLVEGDGEHLVQQLLHFPSEPSVTVSDETAIEIKYPAGPFMCVRGALPSGTTLTLAKAQEKPIQGWVSSEYGEKQGAPAAVYSWKGKLPVSFVSVFYPSATNVKLEVAMYGVQMDGHELPPTKAIALVVGTEGQQDTLMLAPDIVGLKRCLGRSADSQLWLRRARAGSVPEELQIGVLNSTRK